LKIWQGWGESFALWEVWSWLTFLNKILESRKESLEGIWKILKLDFSLIGSILMNSLKDISISCLLFSRFVGGSIVNVSIIRGTSCWVSRDGDSGVLGRDANFSLQSFSPSIKIWPIVINLSRFGKGGLQTIGSTKDTFGEVVSLKCGLYEWTSLL